MANPNTPPDAPVAISAAELRRRLLASTPPPIAAGAASAPETGEPIEDDVPVAAPAAAPANWNAASSTDMLARLRMPGKSGGVPVPPARPAAAAPPAPPAPIPDALARAAARRPATGGRYDGGIAGALNHLADLSPGGARYDDSPHGEIQRLRNENGELRQLLDEMKQLLQEASEVEQRLVTKEREFEAALAERDAQIAELSAQLGAIEEQIAKGELAPPPPIPKTRTELEEWGDELERESAKITQDKKKIEEERRQLREDEEALEHQMRQMEVSMARERALLARQETELKRLNAEIQHELEILQRGDAGLREQMAKFQRRAQDVMTKPPGGPPPGGRR